MAMLEKKMFAVIQRNYDCKVLADKLNAISARRAKERGGGCVEKIYLYRRRVESYARGNGYY